ncbi:DNA invertase Pin-like site-specific DNA recombinase [Rhodococcus percolatus]|uniref:recombinase family protein n=1 Tax=Rhodococcus opacus TaxID=37919 RepID=UPI0017FFFABF|nr:recombinase family protein [Rhodococcus opacus]MBA8960130.1 DNA invertase Pin-like site-specific DNA recombinase [Rhodococcus opacus]MBP2205695.1 DNA invertase Pin-like site-specific DNA recombinase [Rhodococcus opacus]
MRISRATDESTSIERQREFITRWAEAHGHTVVGWAVDEDVSGSVDPFDTPALGPWLTDPSKAHEWDILAAWKLDRLGRNAIQLNKLFGWTLEHGKTLVSCSESMDLSTTTGRMLAAIIAGIAEGELEAIRERTLASRAKLREVARWPGGKPPFGYTAVKRTDGQGWRLEVDPLARSVVRRIVDSVLDDQPFTATARILNEEGVLTPGDYYRTVRAGTPSLHRVDGIEPRSKWAATTIRQLLRSKALRGHVHHNGETVRGDDGQPLKMADHLVSADEWELIQAYLDRRAESRKGIRRSESSPLSGVAVCLVCDNPLHHSRHTTKGHHYRYYRCPEKHTTQIPAEKLETLVEEGFLRQVGDLEVRERVWVPGDTREAELREAVRAYDELRKLLGTVVSSTAEQRLRDQLTATDVRIAELESTPAREARWEYRATGGTYLDAWGAADTDGRRELLLRSGITVAVHLETGGVRRSKFHDGTVSADIRIPFGFYESLGLQRPEYLTEMFGTLTEIDMAGVEIGGGKAVFVSKTGERTEFPLT